MLKPAWTLGFLMLLSSSDLNGLPVGANDHYLAKNITTNTPYM